MSPWFRPAWVTLLISLTAAQAWASLMNNQYGGRWNLVLLVLGLPVIWVWVSAKTNSLLFDAMLYDSLVALVYGLAIALLTHKTMTPTNWAGVILVVLGLVLIKR